MIDRRTMLAGLAAGATTAAIPTVRAQSYKQAFPELVFAVVPAENASGVTDRWAPFVAYLNRQLGTKVTLRVANDYAAVIEGQRAGNIHIGYYGPASFSRALVTGVKATAFVIDVNSDGSRRATTPSSTCQEGQPLREGRRPQGQGARSRRPQLHLRLQHAALRAEQAWHQRRAVLLQGADHRQPRERRCWPCSKAPCRPAPISGTRPDDSNLTRMLNKGMIKRRGWHARHGRRLPHHPEVRPDHQRPDRLPRQPAARPEDRHHHRLAGRRQERQGRLRQAVGWQEQALPDNRQRRLRRHDQADHVRRQAAQAERLMRRNPLPCAAMNARR